MFGSRARDIDLAVEGGRSTDFILDVKDTTSTLLNFDIVDLEKTEQGTFLDSLQEKV